MSTSTLKTRAVVLLLGATLACGVRPAQTQYSPAARQTLVAILNGAPPYEQRLIMNAIWSLGPRRAEMELRQISAMAPAVRQAMAHLVTQILQGLPQQDHQMFINGVFDVSPEETQFVQRVAGPIFQQVGQDDIATRMIAGYGGDIRTMQANGFQQTQTFLGQQAEGWSGTLGVTTQFRGNSGWRGEGYTPSVGMQMYRCGAYNVLLPNNGLPSVGCEQVYTR